MWRIIALVIHWLGILTLLATVQTTADTEGIAVLAFLGIIVTSGLMTRTLLSGIKVIVQDGMTSHDKMKRELNEQAVDARTQLLMALLTEEERARMRKRLVEEATDGETIAIDELLYDRQNGSSN